MKIDIAMMLLAGFVLGAGIVWLFCRQMGVAQFNAGKSEASQELAVMTERLQTNLNTLNQLREELGVAEGRNGEQQLILDGLRQDNARLLAHAERIPTLEGQLIQRENDGKAMRNELVRLSAAEAEKAQRIMEQQDRLNALIIETRDCKEKLEQQASEIKSLVESKATLEEQAGRIPALEELAHTLRERERLLNDEVASLREKNGQLSSSLHAANDQLTSLTDALNRERAQREMAQAEAARLGVELAEQMSKVESERQHADEKLALLGQARDELTTQFQNLANQILEEKAKKFTEQNQSTLGSLLQPLQVKIKEFQEQVAQTYDKDSKERLTLKNEIERLAKLNSQISEDAVNLTQALKGSNKTQGIWGEMVLESVLESSGLRKGQEYIVQTSFEHSEGGQHRPDVVINLPEGKHMVVDSKVSLIAYERYVRSDSDVDRQEALKQHLASVRAHIRGLSEKNYQTLHGLRSLDFVLMFIPVEPAFMLAVTDDQLLFSDAFNKNVLLVSPSTLLATLRTIANIWRQEHQSRNAQEIATSCAKLYDKFVGFVEDLAEVGRKLAQTQKAFDDANSKLSTGRGNLISQIERVKKLGIKPSKALPAHLLDTVELQDSVVLDTAGGAA